MITFDVILPTIGRQSVFDAIESVKAQTYPNWRLWVICDGINDASWYLGDQQIMVYGSTLPMHSDSGAWARNEGIRLGDNNWIAYIDDDDIWYPNHLTTIVKACTLHPEINMVKTIGQAFSWKHKSPRSKKLVKKMGQINDSDILTIGMAHTRSLFEQTQGWKSCDNHDKDLWHEMLAANGVSLTLGAVTFEFCI